jgi:hypothetical protein
MIKNGITPETQLVIDSADNDGRYTQQQIEEMLRSSLIDDDLKSEILSGLDGMYQCICNRFLIENFFENGQSKLINYPDFWSVGYNNILTIFQKERNL